MKMTKRWVAGIGAILLLAGFLLVRPDAASASHTRAADLIDTNGNPAGRVTFVTAGGKTTITARVNIPAVTFEGFHGFHIHAVGKCEPKAVDAAGVPTPFFTAGGHWSKTPQGHRSHSGDLPSVMILRDGSAQLTVVTDRFAAQDLVDSDGNAVMIHVGPDNFANIPTRYAAGGPDATTHNTGDAGGRLLCGVIK